MAVQIKLRKRVVAGRHRVYDIVVMSTRVLETVGYYKPEGNWSFVKVNLKRVFYWINCGAVCSKRVLKIIK